MIRELFEQDTFEEQFEIIDVELCGEKYRIREFNFHPLNANKVWPGNTVFAGWLLGNLEELKNKKIIELGAGSGILSIFLAKHGIDITTSDYNDTEIPVNIAYNCNLNGISVIPHISHSWGESIDFSVDFDIVVASDILLYVKQYGNLIETLKKLLEKPQSKFWLSNRRRIDTESSFLDMCTASGLSVQNIGPKQIIMEACTKIYKSEPNLIEPFYSNAGFKIEALFKYRIPRYKLKMKFLMQLHFKKYETETTNAPWKIKKQP